MNQIATSIYEFGEFRLDVDGCVLWQAGEIVDVTPKALEILCVLVENSGQVVTKEELLKRVWSDSFVEEANLSHHIFRLRRALGESLQNKFIETVPKRGYRFAVQVESKTNGAVSPHLFNAPNTEETTFSANNPATLHPKPFLNSRLQFILPALAVFFIIGFLFLRLGQTPENTINSNLRNSNFSPMKTVPLTTFPNDEFDSALSPDGKYTAFSWFGEDNKNLQIYVKQTDAGKPLRLTESVGGRDGSAAWSPDGRFIAFVRQSAQLGASGIYVIPALGGTERKLFALATSDLFSAGLDWSADGKWFVFSSRRSAAEPFAITLLNAETLEAKPLTAPPAQSEGDCRPDFSPDGQTVAFSRITQETIDIYLTNLSGETRRLTFDNLEIIGSAWMPDGKSLIFSSNRGGGFALWRIKTEESAAPEPLMINAEKAFDPSISRTGNRLTFTQIQKDTNIWRVRGVKGAASEVPVQLVASSRSERNPRYSPDGQRIAYISDSSGSFEIWTSSAQGLNAVQITNFGGAFTNNPRWSPDGSQIVFDSRPDGYSDIFTINSEGGTPRRLTSGAVNNIAPSFSSDGRRIYYGSDASGAWQIWRIPASGGQPEQITAQGGFEAVESADGKKLFYTKFNVKGIFELSLTEGGEEKMLFPFAALSLNSGDWTVTPNGIYFVMRRSETHPTKASIDFFNFETSRIETAAELDKDPGSYPGLNLSPDGQWFVLSKVDFVNHDISLVENFR